MYKVKWKGYGPHEMTWEPIENITNAKELIEDFHKKHPGKPRAHTIMKIEFPLSMFPKELFRPIPEPLTEPTPLIMPTESMALSCARRGRRALGRV